MATITLPSVLSFKIMKHYYIDPASGQKKSCNHYTQNGFEYITVSNLQDNNLEMNDNVFSHHYGIGKVVRFYGRERQVLYKNFEPDKYKEGVHVGYPSDGIYGTLPSREVDARNCRRILSTTDPSITIQGTPIKIVTEYPVFVDEKVTVWSRSTLYVEADSQNDAAKKVSLLLQAENSTVNDVAEKLCNGDIESQTLFDTELPVSLKDNNGFSTIEVLTDEEEKFWQNGKG